MTALADVPNLHLVPGTRSRPAMGGESDIATEDAMALTFVERFGDLLKWSPGLGWMIKTGNSWQPDKLRRHYHFARELLRDLGSNRETRVRTKMEANKTVHAVVDLASSDPRLTLPASEWDADPWVLNTPEGAFDLRSGEQVAASFQTLSTSVAPDSGSCSAWLGFLDAVFGGDTNLIEYIQRVLGYCLTGDRSEQKLFFFHGRGSNGKSTLIEIVQSILGSYALKLPSSLLMQAKFERHPASLAQLLGKRLAVSSEIPGGSVLDESLVKELTGDTMLNARFMRQDPFQFVMTHKNVVLGNDFPSMRGGDPALARRLAVIPFNRVFSGEARDLSMAARLAQERPQILGWLISGAIMWRTGGIRQPAVVDSASLECLAEQDAIATWLEERCELNAQATTAASELLKDVNEWLVRNGFPKVSGTALGTRLAAVHGIARRRSNGIRYSGIDLRRGDRRHG